MGFWSKLGKIGLAAAPYIAAPFTGGASLSFAPMTNKALGAWNAKDAQNNAAQGLGPSKFDSILGMGSNLAGAVSSFKGGGDEGDGESSPMGGGNIMNMIKNLAPSPQAAEAPQVSQNRPALTTPQYGMVSGGSGGSPGASAPQSGAALGPSDNFVQQLAGSTKARMDQAAMSRPKPQMRKKSFQYA